VHCVALVSVTPRNSNRQSVTAVGSYEVKCDLEHTTEVWSIIAGHRYCYLVLTHWLRICRTLDSNGMIATVRSAVDYY
jgi:hypothetical protein